MARRISPPSSSPTPSPTLLTPGNTFTGEKLRGFVASMTSGATASGLNFAGMALGLSPAISSLLAVYVLGNLLTYWFDILFAKKVFTLPNGFRGYPGPFEGPVPYSAFGVRFAWMLRSMVGPQFFRYVISVVIDTLTGLAMLKTALDVLDAYDILTDDRYKLYRDFGVSSIISFLTFFLFANVLRFDWAYTSRDDHVMNIVVLAWLALSIMAFAIIMRPPERRRNESTGSRGKDKGEGEGEGEEGQQQFEFI